MKPLTIEGTAPANRRKTRASIGQEARIEQGASPVTPKASPPGQEMSESPVDNKKMTVLLEACRQECFTWATQTLASPSMKNIHEFRRSIRKFKTYLWLLPLPSEHPALEDIHRCLRKTHRLLGHHRTFEVALQDAKKYDLPTANLEKKLRSQHQKLQKKLPTIVEKNWAQVMAIPLDKLGPFTLNDSLEKVGHASERLLQDASSPPQQNTARHKLRLRVKKISIFLKTLNAPQGSLGNLQKALGRWHDLLSLEHLAAKGLGPAMEQASAQKSLAKIRKDRKASWRRAKKNLGELISEDFLKNLKSPEHRPPLVH